MGERAFIWLPARRSRTHTRYSVAGCFQAQLSVKVPGCWALPFPLPPQEPVPFRGWQLPSGGPSSPALKGGKDPPLHSQGGQTIWHEDTCWAGFTPAALGASFSQLQFVSLETPCPPGLPLKKLLGGEGGSLCSIITSQFPKPLSAQGGRSSVEGPSAQWQPLCSSQPLLLFWGTNRLLVFPKESNCVSLKDGFSFHALGSSEPRKSNTKTLKEISECFLIWSLRPFHLKKKKAKHAQESRLYLMVYKQIYFYV